jgi:hypothetical protein
MVPSKKKYSLQHAEDLPRPTAESGGKAGRSDDMPLIALLSNADSKFLDADCSRELRGGCR